MTQAFAPDWFSAPGSTLTMLMARERRSTAELARCLNRDTSFVLRLISGTEPIEGATAQMLSDNLGGTPAFWKTRQEKFEQALDRAASAVSADTAKSWLRTLPMKELSDAGWLTITSKSNTLHAALTYFNVMSPEEWRGRYAEHATKFSYRTSETFQSKLGALAAWLRQGELQAAGVTCAKWNAEEFRKVLMKIRGLTRLKEPAMFVGQLRGLCAQAGVAVVFVKAPAGCRASGATRFIRPDKAMIILSFRHLSDDHFWFSFYHEAAHLLLHGPSATFVDGEAAEETVKEREANAFAAGALIPLEHQDRLFALRATVNDVVRFAVTIGIAPGVVVGQLQHHGLIGPHQLNGLKRRYNWEQVLAAVTKLTP